MDLGHEQVDVQQLAELFKVLGDPTRIRIVRHLLNKEMCVSEIADTMGMGQSAISHQLRVLRQARLVTFRKEGKTAWYSLNDEHVVVLLKQGIEHVSHQ
ncbi:helix-turn-helix transcriptional regulator [uncultured Veillonella sp.]|uniref:ArsR/SmtB family transcription factor n=1 Tax=uncultured Veillonella sp. TaxID=159268 RepID=UPI0025DA984E|nr:metalloregulator ArsR/SmtB family transcription factor [uncultured Veillonella sp.]MDY3973817.1 metalloregulator ArsR/SmtB family transcription factor [Veillonella caviae]